MKQNNGNVLFLILAAIVLFAGFTYAVSQSGESTGDVDDVQLRIQLSEFISNMEILRTTIAAMKARGVTETELSFEHSGPDGGFFVNPNCTTNACRIFHPEGGGLTYIDVASSIHDPAATGGWVPLRFSGSDPFFGHGTDGTSPANSDLVANVNANEESCVEFNKLVDFTEFEPGSGPDVQAANHRFTGTYTHGSYVIDEEEFFSVKAFCTQHDTNHEFRIYYILMAR